MNQTTKTILIILTTALVVSAGFYIWYSTGQSKEEDNLLKREPSKIKVLESEKGMISDRVYKSDKFNFEIAIPTGVVIEEKENEMGGGGVVLFRDNSEVLFSIDIPGSGQKYIKHSDDKATQRQEILKGKQITVIKAPSGECDGQGCNGVPFVSYVIEEGGQYYTLTFYDKIALTNEDQQILESFQVGEVLNQ